MKRIWTVALFLILWGCGGKNVETNTGGNNLDEPDRVLYDRAMHDLEKSRYNVARLTLQTLINTYPDSEYLPQAKYALAESFYREGGSSNYNQAEAEFKDYITFFPVDPRAADAQFMIAMTHVRQMEKPDRDPTQAQLAEAEFKKMIENYADSPLLDDAKKKLRGVQEVLAEGVFKIGNQYLIRRSYRAATDRYREVLQKYPDYSGIPEVLFSLAESLKDSNNEPESAIYYSKIVSDHPYSDRVQEAKNRLTEMKMPIPEPNPAALAHTPETSGDSRGLFAKVFGMFNHKTDLGEDAVDLKEDPEGTKTKDGSFSIDPKVVDPGKPAKKP